MPAKEHVVPSGKMGTPSAPRVARVAEAGELRLLTVLSYDLAGSTDLLAQSGVEDFHDLMATFQANSRKCITSRGGLLISEAGDGGVALFPLDVDAKDAASLAINAALEIIDRCQILAREVARDGIHVRVGIASSMVLVQGDQRLPTSENVAGLAFALATRLQGLALPDTVLVSHDARRLARRSHVFSFQGQLDLKGFAQPEATWRAVRHRVEVDRFFAFGRLNCPIIGRVAELRYMANLWSGVVNGRGATLLLEGEAGAGKSRLLHELRRMTQQTRKKMLVFQCLPGGADTALHPLLHGVRNTESAAAATPEDTIKRLFRQQGINDDDVVDVFSFMLGARKDDAGLLKDVPPDLLREKVRSALSRAVADICAAGPVVVIVEDCHWIDPTSRSLLTELVAFVKESPLLLVLSARPDSCHWLADPDLAKLSLHRLGPEETRTAIATMLPSAPSPYLAELIDRVSGGIPFFIEETCQYLAASTVEAEAEEQVARALSLDGGSVLELVLDARLKALGQAREIARAASVVGVWFNVALLRELMPALSEESLAEGLDRLVAADFLTRARYVGGDAFAFRHALIQETIYGGLLKRARQAYHREIVATFTRDPSVTAWLDDAALAEHAYRGGLLAEAIDFFVSAGQKSFERSAVTEAMHLLERARELCLQIKEVDAHQAALLPVLAALGPVLIRAEGSASPRTQSLYATAIEMARRRPRPEQAALFPIYWGWWFTGTDVDNKRAQEILADLQDVDDPDVQLQARHCIWAIDFYLGRHVSCMTAVDAALPLYHHGRGKEAASLYGGHDAMVCGLAHRGLSAWLTGNGQQAEQSVAAALKWAMETGHAGSIAHAHHNRAMLQCYRRDFAGLADAIADLRPLIQRNGLRSLAATIEIFEGWSLGVRGQYEDGIDLIEMGLAAHRELQTPEDYPVYCDMLGELLFHMGDCDKALELLADAEKSAETNGHRYWLAALELRRAKLLLRQNANDEPIAAAFTRGIEIAVRQGSVPLLLNLADTADAFGHLSAIAAPLAREISLARSSARTGLPLIVNPEPPLRQLL
ncbi:MAG: AAA family ATPase [Proteobacteria bacterium]|nr:AAA family ATPase [Pseudomonadota bacterium]